jgi:hypothetical protein
MAGREERFGERNDVSGRHMREIRAPAYRWRSLGGTVRPHDVVRGLRHQGNLVRRPSS